MGTRQARFGLVDSSLELQWPGDHRHHRVVAVVADPHLHLAAEIDALDELEEAVDEVLPRLLAVGDDVEPGVLLRLEPEERGVALRLLQLLARRPPGRPELARLGEPRRLRQAAR